MLRIVLISFSLCASPSVLAAQCLTANTGAGCATAPIRTAPRSTGRILGPAPIEIGTFIERGQYSILMNAPYYGLPRARDGWVYYRIEDDVYRVDYNTMEVLERATAETSANWPP